MTAAHTPLPWQVAPSRNSVGVTIWRNDGNDENTGWARICRNVKSEADAAFIVRAVNSHGQLVAALRGLFDDYKRLAAGSFELEELDVGKDALAALAVAEAQP